MLRAAVRQRAARRCTSLGEASDPRPAGIASTKDPKYIVVPERERLMKKQADLAEDEGRHVR
jgi:hypothetical protein